MKWDYGEFLVKDGQLESLNNWSNLKEVVLFEMDRNFDYLWWEDEEGIHFVDRLYYDHIEDDLTVIKKRKANELELHFKNIEEVKNWLIKKGVNKK